MKIALIHHQLAHGGGMETYFVDLIHEFHRLGHEVHVFTAKVAGDILMVEGVSTHLIRCPKWPKLLRRMCFGRKLQYYFKQHFFDLTLSTTRLFAGDILVSGGTHKGYLQTRSRWHWSDRLECFLEQRAYHKSGHVVAHSPLIENELRTLYALPSQKVTMRYAPINPALFTYQHKPAYRPFRLLFASTSHRRKGGFLLLDALRLLPQENFELWIAGRPFKQAHDLKQKVRELGYVHDMNALFHGVDLLVLPSYFEPFGLVAAQALECGTPVLVSQRCGIAPLIAKNEGLILKEQRAQKLAKLLMQAKETNFTILPQFTERNRLTLAEHVASLIQISQRGILRAKS